MFNSVMNRFAQRILPFRLFYHVKTPLIASTVMGLISYGLLALHVHILSIILVSMLTYGAMLIALKDPIIQDVKTLLQKIKS